MVRSASRGRYVARVNLATMRVSNHEATGAAIMIRASRKCSNYSETVCTTLLTGRVLATGSFMSLIISSSYSGRVCTGALALI